MPPNKTILVVDDEEIARDVAQIALESEYYVQTAASAEDMQKKLEENIPDLILLDLYMPGASGFEALFSISTNQKWCKIPVIFVTSEDDIDIEKEALSCGVFDYIKKPYSAESLQKSVAFVFASINSNNNNNNTSGNETTGKAENTNTHNDATDKVNEDPKSSDVAKTIDAASKIAAEGLEALSEGKDYVLAKYKDAKSALKKILSQNSENEK